MPDSAEVALPEVHRLIIRIELLYPGEGVVLYLLSRCTMTIQAHGLKQDGLKKVYFSA